MARPIVGFEHLHLHSHKSLLDGFGTPDEYAARWKPRGDYLCISDHGMMAVIPEQIRACEPTNEKDDSYKDKKLNPIFACELYINPLQIEYDNDKQLKDYIKSLPPDEQKLMRRSYHLLAIAYNEVGYSNLVTLTSLAWIKGFYYRPRVNHQQLMQYKEGIIFTSCCYASEVGQAFDRGGEEAGFAMIEKYMAMFGNDYRLEFMLLDFIKQKPYDAFIMKSHDKYKVPMIVTNDCHYCEPGDSKFQRLMLMVQTKNTVQDIERKLQEVGEQDLFELQDQNLWMKTEEELNDKWEKDYSDVIDYDLFEQAKKNTVEICRMAGNVKLDRSMKLPILPNANERLKEEVIKGFRQKRLPFNKEYQYRLREEFELIFEKQFSSYFLILKAAVDEARRFTMEIFGTPNAVGPGRGCLASYVNIVIADGGFKKIKDVEIGDKVVCSDGSVNMVLDKFKYPIEEELLCIKSYYGDNCGVTLTKDHKILVEKITRPANYDSWAESTKASRKSTVDPVGNLEWVPANKVAVGDWVFIPTPVLPEVPFNIFDLSILQHDKTVLTFDDEYVYQGKLNPLTKNLKPVLKLSRHLNLDNDIYRVLGMFAGDGWLKSNDSCTEVGFAFNKKDREKVDFLINFMHKIGISVKVVEHDTKELTQCKIYSRHFQLFIKYCFPKYKYTPHTKHVPAFVFNQDENRKKAFLKGYFFADGSVGEYKCDYSTVSESLASQTRFLCWQVGIPASLCFNNRIDKRNGRESVEIKINIPHHLAITESRDGQECFYRKINNGFLMKVRSVEKVNGINEVYDLHIENQHNYLTTSFQVHNSDVGSLVCYCLGITTVNPIKHGLLFSRFLSKARKDWPDADVDFLPAARDHIKNDWAPKYFGQDKVSNIGSYNTFGIKSSLIDMARVYGKDRNEILGLTTKIGLKDEDGSVMTWDKAQEIFPELKKYCEDNPDVAEAAQKLIGRNRSMGKHAGGVVISSVPINKFVPLVRGKGGEVVSAWTQGLHDQDLEPMGFIKYDWLVITNLEQINYACKLIKERYGVKSIWAKEGQEDWSDDNFITDAKAITMANEADLKGIFQFDSEGIRNLVKRAGINGFDDLVAITALYRPGPMGEGQHDEFVARKKGEKSYELHLLLEPILGNTYGVICVHEDAMISLTDGREVALKLVKNGDFVHSVNEKTKVIESNLCYGSLPTKRCDGVKITLTNGYSVTITNDHKILTYDGMKTAVELHPGIDLIAIPKKLNQKGGRCKLAKWLGKDIDVAYLLGQLIGDGAVSQTNIDICSGDKNNHNKLLQWLTKKFAGLNFREYYHCRSWYIAISGKDFINNPEKYGNRKTKFNVLLEELGVRFKNCYNKVVPEAIMMAKASVRRAFIAGLLDSDGRIGVDSSGGCVCNITSVSPHVRTAVRKLLLMDGISNSLTDLRVYIQNTLRLNKYIAKYLVIKQIHGKLHAGQKQFYIPRKTLKMAQEMSGLSIRQFCDRNGIYRDHFKSNKIPFISAKFRKVLGIDNKDVNYVRIDKIEKVYDQQFYGLAVENNHNYVADGIIVSNCFQEQCMKIFNVVGDIPLEHCYNLIKAISKKKKEIFDDYKVQFIENGQKNLGWTLEEVEALWKQLEGFAGYAFNLSHAVAYTYISFMLLVLKAHYPLEFFASILHYESVAEKMKEYKCDAEKHEIKTDALDLNKSRVYFDITDNVIYFGFANVKGIGEGVAERIIANQPYASFSDFLDKFGTDESVIKPLIGLGLFTKDGTPEILYKYYKWHKDIKEKREARKKRFEVTCQKHMEEAETVQKMELPEEERANKLLEIQKKVDRSVSGYHNKPTIKDPIPPLSEFLMEQSLKEVAGSEQEPNLDEKLIQLFHAPEECEQQFYGFLWHHPLRNSPDYEGNRTFEIFREKGEPINYVEVIIKSAVKQTSKKNKDVNYWLLKAEDANGEEVLIQVWQDEWNRFGPELKVSELVKLKLKLPDKGFSRYTLWSPKKWPKWEYDKLIPKDRTFDFRVVSLRKGEFK